jgi:hypothetical protein
VLFSKTSYFLGDILVNNKFKIQILFCKTGFLILFLFEQNVTTRDGEVESHFQITVCESKGVILIVTVASPRVNPGSTLHQCDQSSHSWFSKGSAPVAEKSNCAHTIRA